MTQPAIGTRMIRAADGREYEFWINEYEQRFWRCVEDHSVLVPYCVLAVPDGISTQDNPMQPAPEPWHEGMDGPGPFWE